MTCRSSRTALAIPRALAAVLLVLGAAGCANLFTKTPLPLYHLTAPRDFTAGLSHVPVQLVVATPEAPHGLDTARIALTRPSLAFDYLADGEWTGRVPEIVRDTLIEGFENSRTLAGVSRETFNLRADFILDSELRHFEAGYDSPAAGDKAPTVQVTLALKLIKVPENTIVAQGLISAQEAAAANATPQIVAAFDAALASAVRQTVAWTLASPGLSPRRR